MAISTRFRTGYGYDTTAISSTTDTSWYTAYDYNHYSLRVDPYILPEAKPKKKTFEEELQSEIDDWLSIFKEN